MALNMNGTGVFWYGQDGDVYVKGTNTGGVQNIGSVSDLNNVMKNGNDVYSMTLGKTFSQIDDPVNGSRNEGGTDLQSNFYAGGGSGSSSGNTSADAAYLDDQQARLEAQKGYARKSLSDGLVGLTDSYNKSVTDANGMRSRALEDFSTKREDTTRAKDIALDRVDSNARTLANSLRQRLGLASGSDSSAYQFSAPGAVARQATQNRAGVVENYGQNFRDLATSENRAKVDFESLLADLAAQRKGRESDFRSAILDKMNEIDTSLSEVARQRALLNGGGYQQVKSAMSPYSTAIDQRNSEISQLFDKYRTPYTVKAVNVQAPSLRDYTVDRTTVSGNGNGASDMTTNPYYTHLKKTNDEYSY